jgi:uncharacterized protein (TIRG00374 family)
MTTNIPGEKQSFAARILTKGSLPRSVLGFAGRKITSKYKYYFLVGKISISIGLITWLLMKSSLGDIWESLITADLGIITLAFLLFFVNYYLNAVRWNLLLKAQNISAHTGFLVESIAISLFLNNFLPSTIGGDVYRMYDSWRLGSSKGVAVSVVLVDRAIGLFTLILYALIASFFTPYILENVPYLNQLLIAAIICFTLAGWTIFSGNNRYLDHLSHYRDRYLRQIVCFLDKISSSFCMFRGRSDVLMGTIGLSMLVHLTVFFVHLLIAVSLNIDVPMSALFLIIPLSAIILMLPVTINGIGLREMTFVFLLSFFGIEQSQAIAFAWLSFGMTLLQGVIGGIVFLMRKPLTSY